MNTEIGQAVINSLNNGLLGIAGFVPKLLAGLIIFLLGIVIASILKQVITEVFKAIKLESILKRYGVPEAKEEFTWTNILAEIIRWFVIILFLIPTAEVWGLPQIVTVLNAFLFYLPNVFVAAIITLIGFVFARLGHDVVRASTHGLAPETSRTIASVTRWAITIFVLLAVLTQLGVAADLIRILFTGFVAMVAIAGGLAFGLGGKDFAADVLAKLKKKL